MKLIKSRSTRDIRQRSLSNFLKVEITIESGEKCRGRYQQLGQGRVYIHEITCLDITPGEFTKVNFIEPIHRRNINKMSRSRDLT